MTIERFTFCHNDNKPCKKMVCCTFYYIGYLCFLIVICASAGFVWGLLVKFTPKTMLALQYFFQPVTQFLTL